MTDYPRDLVGYAGQPPHADWPEGARIAVQFVLNYEEGAENCVLHGDKASECFLSEIVGAQAYTGMRHMNMESLYEYGSRAGFWRLHRLFCGSGVPVTVFGVAMALERNPAAVRAMLDAGWEIASHGYRWIDYQFVDESVEREHLHKAIALHTGVTGSRPAGFYLGRCSPNTHRLAATEGVFEYVSDSYADDLPYWDASHGTPQLVVPYTLDVNDMRFASPQGFNSGEQFFTYLKDTFDVLFAEGERSPAMMSVGLHCRLAGRPGRSAAVARFIEYVQGHKDVWLARRIDIARHWKTRHPFEGIMSDDQFSPPPEQMDQAAFVARFGGVYEHSPWVAKGAWQRGAKASWQRVDGMSTALATVVNDASPEQQLALIRAHPDLAGKAALRGELGAESTQEQRGAGLDQCSPEELAAFTQLNAAYVERFGFPFVMAVKNSDKAAILAGFKARLRNDAQSERATALREIHTIARLRLQAMAAADSGHD